MSRCCCTMAPLPRAQVRTTIVGAPVVQSFFLVTCWIGFGHLKSLTSTTPFRESLCLSTTPTTDRGHVEGLGPVDVVEESFLPTRTPLTPQLRLLPWRTHLCVPLSFLRKMGHRLGHLVGGICLHYSAPRRSIFGFASHC
jgi:hypothetical protein